jgi:MYXO-CTERM domain-containing protein
MFTASSAWCAAPTFKVLYHESIKMETHVVSAREQRIHLEAYGKSFDLELTPNDGIRAAVPAGRTDIQPFAGTVSGLPGSWVRLTRTRAGWRGMIFDGTEIYAIEPAADIADSAVQPLDAADPTSPVIYRLADALMTVGPNFCDTLTADQGASGPSANTTDTLPGAPATPAPTGETSAKKVFEALAKDMAATAGQFPSKRLMTGVVADYEFATKFSADPEGAIIARMDIVDGIWTSQAGVKIALAPITVISTSQEPFTTTVPNDLLAQVRKYRSGSSAQMSLGVTHLMTGRDLDGNTVGIAYMGSVCQGDTAVSLSEGSHSTAMSALIAAHELGHNFNAPHDGDASGACASTPQTFLMAPTINMSNQFSACSLQQIQARIQTAQCLTAYTPPSVSLSVPSAPVSSTPNSPLTLKFSVFAAGDDASNNVAVSATLPTTLVFQSANVAGGACSQGAGTVTCQIGSMTSGDSRDVTLNLTTGTVGTSTVNVDVSSSNNSNTANDSASISANIQDLVTVATATPPTTASSSTSASSSGGGGGGAVDESLLAALGLALALAVRRKVS